MPIAVLLISGKILVRILEIHGLRPRLSHSALTDLEHVKKKKNSDTPMESSQLTLIFP